MANPYSSACKATGQAKMRALGGKVTTKTVDSMIKKAMGAHDKQLHGMNKHTNLKAVGLKGGGRLDKIRRDKGGIHKRSKINVSAAALKEPSTPIPPSITDMPSSLMPPAPPMGAGMPSGLPPSPLKMPSIKRGGRIKRAMGGRLPKAGAETGVARLQQQKRARG